MRQITPIMIDLTHHTRSRRVRSAIVRRVLALLVCLAVADASATAATFRSPNYVVTASSVLVARQIADVAEDCRRTFSEEWLSSDLPNGEVLCHILVEEKAEGGRGRVEFELYRGQVDHLQIVVTGRLDCIVEYVLPHEVAHAVLAISLGRSLPRWADEGVALLCESENQQSRQRKTVAQLASTDGMMPLKKVLQLVDYPQNRRDLVNFYAASFSLTEYLVTRGGKQRLMGFAHDGDRDGWEVAARRHYDSDMRGLESAWKSWSADGDPQSLVADVSDHRSLLNEDLVESARSTR